MLSQPPQKISFRNTKCYEHVFSSNKVAKTNYFFPEGACNLPQPVPGAKSPRKTWSAPEPHLDLKAQETRTPGRARLRTKYSASFSSPGTPTHQVCPRGTVQPLGEAGPTPGVAREQGPLARAEEASFIHIIGKSAKKSSRQKKSSAQLLQEGTPKGHGGP